MPGLFPSIEFAADDADRVSMTLETLPVAALICSPDDRRITCNASLLDLLGNKHLHDLHDVMLDPPDLHTLPCREVNLRGAAGASIATTMLSLPVTLGGQCASLCLFLEREPRGWRNADLVSAIDDVIRADMGWFSGAVMEQLARRRSGSTRGMGLRQLTPREREVLSRVCEGRDDVCIARELAISRNTLRNHLANIYGKAGVRRRSEAVVWGRERGLGER